MSWTDKASIEHIKQLRDIFKVDTFVETGTFLGMNVIAHKDNFDFIFSCEKIPKYYKKACKKVRNTIRKAFISIYLEDSSEFLKTFDNEPTIFYLDAHFYDPKLPKNKRFVVLEELKTLKGMDKAIIIIHDFDNGLGHLTYDGIPLDMKLLRKDLLKVNKNFKFYTNELSSCDIMTIQDIDYTDVTDKQIIKNYDDMRENLKYAWSKPEKTYRGILYCVPKEVNIDGLKLIK